MKILSREDKFADLQAYLREQHSLLLHPPIPEDAFARTPKQQDAWNARNRVVANAHNFVFNSQPIWQPQIVDLGELLQHFSIKVMHPESGKYLEGQELAQYYSDNCVAECRERMKKLMGIKEDPTQGRPSQAPPMSR